LKTISIVVLGPSPKLRVMLKMSNPKSNCTIINVWTQFIIF
jgi:hypothetical protein